MAEQRAAERASMEAELGRQHDVRLTELRGDQRITEIGAQGEENRRSIGASGREARATAGYEHDLGYAQRAHDRMQDTLALGIRQQEANTAAFRAQTEREYNEGRISYEEAQNRIRDYDAKTRRHEALFGGTQPTDSEGARLRRQLIGDLGINALDLMDEEEGGRYRALINEISGEDVFDPQALGPGPVSEAVETGRSPGLWDRMWGAVGSGLRTAFGPASTGASGQATEAGPPTEAPQGGDARTPGPGELGPEEGTRQNQPVTTTPPAGDGYVRLEGPQLQFLQTQSAEAIAQHIISSQRQDPQYIGTYLRALSPEKAEAVRMLLEQAGAQVPDTEPMPGIIR